MASLSLVAALAPLRHYSSGRSLWGDEAALARNVLSRDLTALLGPLDHDQIAPFGFLVLTKGATWLFGSVDEAVLRLLPLCAALATGPLVYLTAFALRGRLTAVLAALLAMLAPSVIYYAAEFKPYAIDIFATAALLWLAVRCLERPSSTREVLELIGASCVLVTVSFPAILVAASMLAVIALDALRRDRRLVLLITIAALPLAAIAGVTLSLAQPSPQTGTYMDDFWRQAFVQFPPGGPWELAAAVRVVSGAFEDALTNQALLLVIPVGSLSLGLWLPAALGFRLTPHAAALLVVPWLAAYVASRLGAYPLDGRLAVYLLPTITIGVGSTLAALADDRVRSVRLLLAAALVATLALNALLVVRDSIQREELAPVLREASAAWSSGERVYVYFGARHAFDYYRQRVGAPPGVEFVLGKDDDPARCIAEIEQVAQDRQTLWLLFSHAWRFQGGVAGVKAELAPRWHVVRSIDAPDASAMLIRRRSSVTASLQTH